MYGKWIFTQGPRWQDFLEIMYPQEQDDKEDEKGICVFRFTSVKGFIRLFNV